MSRSQKKVVVLLASRNGQRFIDAQLESIAAQQHSNWQLLISDDGSEDRTAEILERFRARFPDKVMIQDGPRKGFAENFMALLRRDVDGDYYAFCDQDDVWLPDKLQLALARLDESGLSQPALFFSRTEYIDERGRVIGRSKRFQRSPGFRNALVQNIGGGNTMVFNRAACRLLASAPAAADVVSHDWLAYQLVSAVGGQLIYELEPTVLYRQHAENIVGSNQGLVARWDRIRLLLDGRLISWNKRNIAVLSCFRNRMTPENQKVYDCYSKAVEAVGLKRVRYLIRSKVYRQTLFETLGLYVAAILGRI